MDFQKVVLKLVKQIPKGKVTSYMEIAKALGDRRASRAVGTALNQNPRPIKIPCHRVVHSNGEIGGYKLGIEEKIRLLESEGIRIRGNKVANFGNVFFKDFKTDYLLKKLRETQKKVKKDILVEDEFDKIEKVAGFDVAYSRNEPSMAYGACSVFDNKTMNEMEFKIVSMKISFPYVSTYLSFREFPVIQKLMEKIKSTPDILMIDGNGILHPFGVGLASYTGIMLNIPTIGVAKKLLCGKINKIPLEKWDSSEIEYKNRLVGYALKSTDSSLIYISPGHKISLKTSLEITKKFTKYKIPEPIRISHIRATKLSRHL